MQASIQQPVTPDAIEIVEPSRAELIWPPDYVGELKRRAQIEMAIVERPELLDGMLLHYKSDPVAFVRDCVWIVEPRNANLGLPTKLPAVPFPRQAAFLQWLQKKYETGSSGPVEKSRDSGATWMASAFAVWLWLFHAGSSTGFGSRKEMLVDRKGDLNSIMEKVRSIVRNLPPYLRPVGYSEREHSNYMRLINPAMDTAIVGEAGDNIGRGGRTSMYIIDEAAHIDHPEMVDAALTATTDARIDISSPRVGSLFNEWIASAGDSFVFDVRDAPWHTEEWMARKEAELKAKGLGHIYRQEYLRDPTAGVEGQLIPSEWIDAAIDLCDRLGITPTGEAVGALDVADGGADANALGMRYGIDVHFMRQRRDLRADQAGHWAYDLCEREECDRIMYDAIGVGAGAAAAFRNREIVTIGWAASGKVHEGWRIYEGKRKHDDMFANAKSQAFWMLRDRFLATYRWISDDRDDITPDDLISLASDIEDIRQIKSELAQIRYTHNTVGKIVIDKMPKGYRSPNMAEALMMLFAPYQQRRGSLVGGLI